MNETPRGEVCITITRYQKHVKKAIYPYVLFAVFVKKVLNKTVSAVSDFWNKNIIDINRAYY